MNKRMSVKLLSAVAFATAGRFGREVLAPKEKAREEAEIDAPADDSRRRRAFVPLLAAAMSLPFVFTTGAGAQGSRSFGMTFLGGYLAFALVGLPIAGALRRICGRNAGESRLA